MAVTDQVTEQIPPEIGELLRDALARFEHELVAATPSFRGRRMRRVHDHVLRHLDPAGNRPTEIAERAGLSRQAITQIVDELEAAGVVERTPDPDDARAKRVVYTEEGATAFASRPDRMAAIAERWRTELGAERWAGLEAALRELTGHQ
jgi:DNA-binding MarR family transcriptional regulator